MTKPKDLAKASHPQGGLWADPRNSWRNLNTGRLLLSGFEQFEAEVLAALHAADYGRVRRTHFNVMRHLDAEGTRMTDLAARANVTKAAITQLVRACEGLGLVTVETATDDARARVVRFSAEGDALMLFFRDTMNAMERRLQQRLGTKAYADLRAALLDLSGLADVVPFSPARPATRRRAG